MATTTKKKPSPAKAPAPKKTPKVKADTAAKVSAKKTDVAVDKTEKPKTPKKAKLVRDSFTIPKAEYVVLEELKLRAAKLGRPTKKSEVLRAGVQAWRPWATRHFWPA